MQIQELNKEQQKAVNHIDGPMLVLAGAGSGKTKVLTNRIANLIENGISPYNILAITFTNKAAKEMKDRVVRLIGKEAYNIQISTFHSLGLKILKENYSMLGYEKNFTIIDSDDVLTIIKKILKDKNMSKDRYNPREIKNKISSAKNEMMSIDSFAKVEFDHKVVEVYKEYQQKLKNGNSVDFDDLLILPIKLFRNYPRVLEEYQDRYKYILIDEYQDTNEAQYTFSKLLSAKYRNIFVVGDNDQAIYAFRGANYKNILNFEKDYPEAKTILLEENYRSTKTILNAANSVIKNNHERKDKNLWSNNATGNKIKYKEVANEKEEASFVGTEIKRLLSEGINEEDIAVLYRTNAQSRVIEEEMLKKNIKYISLVHDVEELRKSLYNEYYEKEFAIMCMLADVIIVHNDKMKDFFVKKGIPKEKLVVLEIFDYLQKKDSNKTKKYFEKQITVAGNLDINKCKYIGELCKLNKIKIQLYGPNFDNKMKKYSNIQYGGSVPSDIIPKKLISGFGLVWDGNSLEGCRGNTGQYLKYNNPHKLSLYLSSGLPVVVWSQAAEAQFIETNEVGLVVDSLFELQEKLSNMTAKQYDLYAKKTKKIANLLVNGYYTKTALAKALDLIKMEI